MEELDALKAGMNMKPHRVPLRATVNLVSRFNPFTMRREIHLHPLMREALERQGHDPDQYLTMQVQVLMDNGINPLA